MMNKTECVACDKELRGRAYVWNGKPMCERCHDEATALRIGGGGVPRWLLWLLVGGLLAVLLGALGGCATSATGPVVDNGETPIERPWAGDYSSMTETVYLGPDSVVVFVSTQLHLDKGDWCSVHIALSTPDPNGDWADFNTDGLSDCVYDVNWRTVYLTTSIRVTYSGGNFVDRFDAVYQATDETWTTLVWRTYHNVPLERVH